ncbi:peptidase P60 [Iodidimonas gelatinilytica]|nr:C40 family peptidase [Iodidimonas gelatinilytica]GEQ98672.1 peptidase P60 [Iodidimonas gelatinilytica]
MIEASRFSEGQPYVVVSGTTALRSQASGTGAQVSELLFGERFTVYEDRGGWVWGQSARDGYVGYAERTAVAPDPSSGLPTHMVSALFAHLIPTPDLKTSALALLPMSAQLTLGELSPCGGYRRVQEYDGWICVRHIRQIGEPNGDYVSIAERFFGAPYLWGGKTASGIDCSGLVQVAMAAADISMPRDSDLQLTACRHRQWTAIKRNQARRGDLAFFPGHVGIMIDHETLLHANATHMAVTVDPLTDVIDWVGRSKAHPFSGLYRQPE